MFSFITSCIDKEKKVVTNYQSPILGDWYSLDQNIYREYFFNEHQISTLGLSGNIYTYDYNLVNGRELELEDRSGNSVFRHLEKITKVDSFQIVFNNLTLHRLEKNQTLGVYLDDKIEYDSLLHHFLQRNNAAVPIDSLIKMAGEPIDIDELFKESE